jgi:hypothetical protein
VGHPGSAKKQRSRRPQHQRFADRRQRDLVLGDEHTGQYQALAIGDTR